MEVIMQDKLQTLGIICKYILEFWTILVSKESFVEFLFLSWFVFWFQTTVSSGNFFDEVCFVFDLGVVELHLQLIILCQLLEIRLPQSGFFLLLGRFSLLRHLLCRFFHDLSLVSIISNHRSSSCRLMEENPLRTPCLSQADLHLSECTFDHGDLHD